MAAGLALALAGPLLPVQKAEAIDTSVCAKTSTFDCLARFGYGANDTGTWAESYYRGNTADAGYHNCTRFAAFYMAKYLGYGDPGSSYGAAWNWGLTDAEGGATNRTSLKERGFRVDTTPAVGSIAWWKSGHVGVVIEVGNGYIIVASDNYVKYAGYSDVSRRTSGGYYPTGFIHVERAVSPPSSSNVAQYANTIVKWSGDSATAWYVTPDLKRMWIPDAATYNQLKARGVAGPHILSSSVLDQLPDQRNQWVATSAVWTGNRALRRGMEVRSSDGRYRFVMQNDGNLVLYGPSGRALWATSFRTGSWRSQEYVIFQADGNLVTYGGGRAIWSSGTPGSGARFVVQNDGNLVIYNGSNRAVWSSGTAGRT